MSCGEWGGAHQGRLLPPAAALTFKYNEDEWTSMKKEGMASWVFLMLFFGLAALAFWIVSGFVTAMLGGAIMAYIFHPVYRWLVGKTRQETLSALLITCLAVMLAIVPVAFVVGNAADEARLVYIRTLQIVNTGQLLPGECLPAASTLCTAYARAGAFISDPDVQVYVQDAVSKGSTFVITKVTGMLLALPSILLRALIALFTMYYLLKEGPDLVRKVQGLLPVSKRHEAHIINKLGEVTHAVIFGSIVVAVVQGFLGGIGFWAVGIRSPVIWGAIMSIFAVIPFLGTGVIWGPAGIMLLLEGVTGGDPSSTYKGIGLLVYGLLLVSTIDNVIKPRIIGDRAGLHPVMVLVGVLGGLATIGLVGFVIGPLVLALLFSTLRIYQEEIGHR